MLRECKELKVNSLRGAVGRLWRASCFEAVFRSVQKREGTLAEEYWSRDQKEFLNEEFD